HRRGQGAPRELPRARARRPGGVMGAGEPPSRRTAPAELEIIRLVRRIAAQSRAERVEAGIGDDTAVLLPQPGARLLATTDVLVEDVHFRRAWAAPFDIGWEAMAGDLSGIAGKGGRAPGAPVGLGLEPPGGAP